MATIFPSSPTIGDTYQGYEWNGTAWIIIGIDLTQDYATQVELDTHSNASTSVHGISDTSALATQTYADGAASTAQTNAQSYADTAVANLVDTAPTTLDTLNELAAALGDDANFSTTVATSIGTKQDKSSAMVIVDNGADANYARPTGVGAVYWIGSAEPVNAAAYDMWWSG
jgi:hypothetical protein